ncbi:MAG: ABC transporter ATP-binding protein [Candidatus Hydromicrobium sp.]|nr:ABC transporter ATP-binding protein [Candidatus Hydromicrobium sp.]
MNSAISIENVKKTLGNREVLKGISFSVEMGDIFGYLGPNGAGKTTTIRILLGLLQANSGKLDILGKDINLSETRRKIGFILDSDGLYDNMTAEENLVYYSKIYGLPKAGERIDELLSMMDLGDRAKDRVSTYSRGMRQRLALARAMVHNPEVLVLDEPTAGVDPSGQIEMRQIMLNIAHKENKTIFLSSHNLNEVQRICNRIALIDRGEIKLYGELESLRRGMSRGGVVIEIAQDIPESLLAELKSLSHLGFQEKKKRTLIFSPQEGTEISDIISLLAGRGVKIEEASRKEASLEEMYSTILKEAEPL